MPFITDAVYTDVEGSRKLYKLKNNLIYLSEGYGGMYSVPAGFNTDFASIPRILRSLVPQDSRQAEPATLHDYFYTRGTKYNYMTRGLCDLLFLEALKANKIGLLKRYAMFLGVRLGGWVGFRKNNKR